jgi:hypothetical protein
MGPEVGLVFRNQKIGHLWAYIGPTWACHEKYGSAAAPDSNDLLSKSKQIFLHIAFWVS